LRLTNEFGGVKYLSSSKTRKREEATESCQRRKEKWSLALAGGTSRGRDAINSAEVARYWGTVKKNHEK